MRILFLDIDGVLNSTRWSMSRGLADYWPTSEVDPAAVAVLNEVISRTSAKIVVSSTWRLGHSLDQLRDILVRSGLKDRGTIIGKTPDFSRIERHARPTPDGSFKRGHEIQAWLSNFDHCRDDAPADVEHFAIVDDDEDMAHLDGNLVRTTSDDGLLLRHAMKLVELLGCVWTGRPYEDYA